MEASKRPDGEGEEEVEEGGGGEDIMGKTMMVVVRVQEGMLLSGLRAIISQCCIKYDTELLLLYYHVWSCAPTDSIKPFQILHFFEVLSLSEVQVESVLG
jgi:hypothetical protein